MRAAIALGSNLPSRFGDPAANLREAVQRLSPCGEVLAVSRFYLTEPIGYLDQPQFCNAALLLQTDLDPLDLLHHLLAVEQGMGRVRAADTPPKGPRVLDLDLLLYIDEAGRNFVLNTPELVLPHPEMTRRRFVLEPLAEIAPTLTVPTDEYTVAALLASLIAAESAHPVAPGL